MKGFTKTEIDMIVREVADKEFIAGILDKDRIFIPDFGYDEESYIKLITNILIEQYPRVVVTRFTREYYMINFVGNKPTLLEKIRGLFK